MELPCELHKVIRSIMLYILYVTNNTYVTNNFSIKFCLWEMLYLYCHLIHIGKLSLSLWVIFVYISLYLVCSSDYINSIQIFRLPFKWSFKDIKADDKEKSLSHLFLFTTYHWPIRHQCVAQLDKNSNKCLINVKKWIEEKVHFQ